MSSPVSICNMIPMFKLSIRHRIHEQQLSARRLCLNVKRGSGLAITAFCISTDAESMNTSARDTCPSSKLSKCSGSVSADPFWQA